MSLSKHTLAKRKEQSAGSSGKMGRQLYSFVVAVLFFLLNSFAAYSQSGCIQASIISSKGTGVCSGNVTTVLSSSVTSSAPITSYSWSSNPAGTYPATSNITVSPTVTTTYSITVKNRINCSVTTSIKITVNPTPTVSVNSGAVCLGSGIKLTATGAGGTGTYSWNPSTALQPSGSVATVTANPTSNISYTVTGTTAAGCSATAVSSVTVNPNPSVSVNSATICAGQSAVLTPSVSSSGSYTYTWLTPHPGLVTSASTATASPASTTIYSVVATNAATSCSVTATSTVSVNPLPTMTVTAGATTLCSGNTTTITASGTAASYNWQPAANISGSNTGSTITAMPATPSTTYTVTSVSAGGCSSTNTIKITVNPTPTVSVNSGAVCLGSGIKLTATGAGGTGTYSWNPSTALQPSGSVATVTASPTSNISYTVTGITAAGCSATAVSSVTVNPNPSLTVNSATICSGQSAVLTPSVSPSGSYTYAWLTPHPGLVISASTATASPTSLTIYSVVATNTATSCSATVTSTVSVNPLPTMTLTAGATTLCSGNTTTITANGTAASYNWQPAANISGSNTGPTITAMSAAPNTTYTLTSVSAGGCSSTNTIKITVNPTPTVSVNSGAICSGQSLPLSATVSPSAAYIYSWSPAGGLNSTSGANVIASPTAPGTYHYLVSVRSRAGCLSSATSTVVVNVTPSVAVNSASICSGQSVTLTASVTPHVKGVGYTLNWSPSNTLNNSSGFSVVATPTTTTHYTITVSTGAGCAATAVATVSVSTTPTVSVNSATICPSQSVTLTSTVTPGGGHTYTWTPSAGIVTNPNLAHVLVSPSVTTVYTVSVSSTTGGCHAQATSTVTVRDVTVNNPSICAGGSSQLNTLVNVPGTYSYNWLPVAGLSSTNAASVTATPSVTTNYTVTVHLSRACVFSTVSTVSVYPIPMVSVNSATICSGGSGMLSSTVSPSGGSYTYAWTPANSGLSDYSSATTTASPSATTVYTVAVTSGPGCQSSATSTVAIAPQPTITVNNAHICYGTGRSVTLTAQGASTYSWSPATGLSVTTGSTVLAYPAVTTTYVVVGTTTNNCTASAISIVTVLNPPIAVSVNPATILIGGTATLTASGATNFQWSPSTGLNTTVGSTVLASPPVTTVYTITANTKECPSSATITVVVTTQESQCYCVNSFAPLPGKKYLVSAWAREVSANLSKTSFTNPAIYLDFNDVSGTFISTAGPFYPSGGIIDGWQRIEGYFTVPSTAYFMVTRLTSASGDVLYDDIRFSPFAGSMKSYVYDPVTLRLVAELDERNYATKYEYDEEGKLTRVKKETEKGMQTIKESRNSQPKK